MGKKLAKDANIGNDRTGGSRRKARVRPPVVHFEEKFTPKTDPPEPFKIDELGRHAVEKGFRDGATYPAQCILENIGYQHASNYFNLFKQEDGSLGPMASMKRLHRAILFDRKLQALLLEHIGLFELQFRARYSYLMSIERGAFAHRNPNNFKDREHFAEFLGKYSVEFTRQLKNRNGDIRRAYDEYGDAPIWLAVEIMSFGTLSMLYRNTKSKAVRKGVAASFGATPDELESWTRALSAVRNTCAHFGRLCGTKMTSRPKKIRGVDFDNSTPFYAILLLEYMARNWPLVDEDTSLAYSISLLRDVTQLFTDFQDVLDLCKIPENWTDILFSPGVVGVEVGFADDFVHRDSATGRVWFNITLPTGDTIEVGRLPTS